MWWDAGAVVGDAHLQLAPARLVEIHHAGDQADLGFGELDRVAQDVSHHLGQQVAVAEAEDFVGREFHLKPDLLGVQESLLVFAAGA